MDKPELLSEIRYAERLCERTVRLYSRLNTFCTFMSIIGGSTVIASSAAQAPLWVPVLGSIIVGIFWGIGHAVRPSDKARANEAEQRRYAKLRADVRDLDAPAIQRALDAARTTDIAEVDGLRPVAYNDVVGELGHDERQFIPLTPQQKLLSALA